MSVFSSIFWGYFLPVLAVVIGSGLVFFSRQLIQKYISIVLSFSGAFLLAITICHLIPELFSCEDTAHQHVHGHTTTQALSVKAIGVWIIVGVFFQKILEYFSKGSEHGHFIQQETVDSYTTTHHKIYKNDKKIPWLIIISLLVHAFFEGMSGCEHYRLWLSIFIHKIPVALLFSSFLVDLSLERWKVYGLIITFGLMTPLGKFLVTYADYIAVFQTQISAIVTGIFMHVSTIILLESNKSHRFNLAKFTVTILAVCIALYI